MNPKKKILILSGCLLTVAAVVGGTFFVQKSSNHVLNKTSIGKFHEAEEHTATGVVVCKTEALQEVFQQKKEEVLLAKQEVPDESEGKNEKTDKKGTQEVTPGKEPTEPASTAGGQTPSAQKNATEVYGLSTESCAICAHCAWPDGPCRHPDRMFPCVESHGIVGR